MGETGSRVQVTLGQTLFHTQWLFGAIDEGDSIRADALLGGARQPIDAASARGALVMSVEQNTLGLTTESREQPRSTGEIDVFVGATELLFTNEGPTPVDLIAAIGCPALEVQTEVVSAPKWDAETQRFVATHEVTFNNGLANARTKALRSQYDNAANTTIDDVAVDVSIWADGFRSAEITDLDLGRDLDRRQNLGFDGVSDTRLLETPLRLTNGLEQRLRFTVSYEPNFDDATWGEGVSVPAPTVTLRGLVDSVQVGLSAQLRPEGVELDQSAPPDRLVTPSSGLVIDHEHLREPESTADGDVRLSERIVVTNSGDTAVDELVVSYALADMYGPGTVLSQVTGTSSHDCAGTFSPTYNGSGASVLVYDPTGLAVGEKCTIDLRATARPGLVPTGDGTEYEAPVVAAARSGSREVRDATAVQATLAQDAQLMLDLAEAEVTNLEDGRYQFDSSLTIRNTGDQNLTGTAARIDFTTSPDGTSTPTPVVLTSLRGEESCPAAGVFEDARTGFLLMLDVAMAPGDECTLDFSAIARPGTALDSWKILGQAEALSPRGVAADVSQESLDLELSEAPAIESSTDARRVVNNADGSYTVEVTTEISNTGDTPLIAVTTSDTGKAVFGSTVIAAERIGDSCSGVSPEAPLRAASQPNGPNSCTVTERYVVAPGGRLTDWMLESESSATSTSGRSVTSSTELDAAIEFRETPILDSSIDVVSIEKVDNANVRLVLRVELSNRGDIEVRSVQAQLDLDAALQQAPFTIESIGADGVIASTRYNGTSQTRLLEGNDEIARDGTAEVRLVVLANTGTESGPFVFELDTDAVSPSAESLEVATATAERTVPLVQLVDRALIAKNNNDGTYDIEHTVIARNAGNIDLPRINVATDFAAVFDAFVVGDIKTSSTCSSTVAAGRTCSSIRTATLRPGSAVGPYTVAASINSADDDALIALVIPEPQDVRFDARANVPLRFQERPSVSVDTDVSEFQNNGDGTYSLEVEATVTNSGDVPLYRVGLTDFSSQFGEKVAGNELVEDTCLDVNFAGPLGPEQSCARSQTITVRPFDALGPWVASSTVTAESPTFATVLQETKFESVTFTETVEAEATSTVAALSNNGDGSYTVAYKLTVKNTGDVPLVKIEASDAGAAYGSTRAGQEVFFDSCSGIALSTPLAPGDECRLEVNQQLRPGSELGPFELETTVTGQSASTKTVCVDTTTNSLTLTESPRLSLKSNVVSVESVDPETFRVVTNLTIENSGDVRVQDLAVNLELDEVFPDSTYRIDGVISNDFVINEAFAAGESKEMIVEGQTIAVDATGVITMILSVETEAEAGPFVGELRTAGTSPSGKDVSAVIAAQVDLPSIIVGVVAQSVDNNRDGSYTVTTSYEITNDGSTPLEFVRLVEDVAAIYEGTQAQTLEVASDDLPVADLTDRRRGNDVLEWGATLSPGSSAVVTTTVLVEPGNVLGPFVPIAGTSAASPTGTPVSASGFAPEEVEFVEQPALRVSQRLLNRPAWNSSGTFDVSFAIDVVNEGDVELRNLQVRQDLLNALGPNAQIRIREVRSETLAVNEAFDGRGQPPRSVEPVDLEDLEQQEQPRAARDIGDTRLLRGWNTLPAGETATIELDLRITPETRGVYSTRVIVSALTPAGTGLGSGGDEIEANTLTRLSVQGEIGVAKQTVGEPDVRPDGSIGVTYEILVENAGPFPLSNVEVHDQLSQAFGVGSTFVTSRVRIEASSPCEGFASSSYDGGTIDPVLVSGVVLAPGEKCRIQYDAVVIPSKPLPGPFRSSAFAIASDPFSGTVIDDSTDGTNTDPDGNQEPGDNDIATSVRVTVPLPEATLAAEPLDSGALDSDDWYEFGYAIAITNDGDIDIDTTRLNSNLDDEWSVPYEVISVTSEDLAVSSSFNGSTRPNLLERRNRLRAGATAVVELRVRAPRTRSGELPLPIEFKAQSVTGDSIDLLLDEPVTALRPGDSLGTSWLDTLTTEEKRLVALGSAAILLFALLFLRRLIIRVRKYQRERAARRAERAARDELFIDLREADEARRQLRAHPPEIDLTEEDDADDEIVVEHYSPRRRRGRRPVDKQT